MQQILQYCNPPGRAAGRPEGDEISVDHPGRAAEDNQRSWPAHCASAGYRDTPGRCDNA
jgi:hypothetical protein